MMTLSILGCLAKAAFINFKSMENFKPIGDTRCIAAMIQLLHENFILKYLIIN